VDVTATLDAPHPPEAVFAWVADLDRYPAWLDIVPRATADGDGSWLVFLRGRLGPLARSKRLRMTRVALDAPRAVRFERDERDGRHHAAWVLEASVEAVDDGSRLTMHLHYGGSLFGPVLERVLGDEIERSRARLLEQLEATA
jgi:carbon monoxide dehydrogenase subunit G